jgi:hypothetical protein
VNGSELETAFPGLAADGYEITSPKSPKYNCISWAAGDTDKKWDCTGLPLVGYYWPPGAKIGEQIDALITVFQILGYESCADGLPEEGFEKLALYGDESGEWTHAAKQTADGRWTSKLGDAEDITHSTPQGVEGVLYGQVRHYLKRALGF